MTFQAQINLAFMFAALLCSLTSAHAAAGTGKVCVQAIPTAESWQANDTGATERSIFTIQIDNLPAFRVSTNLSGVFTNLSLTARHSVRIQLDGKPLTSFHFTFQKRGDHLRLWYNPFYGTWSLSDVRPGEPCACPKPDAPLKSLQPTQADSAREWNARFRNQPLWKSLS